jgi:hypothetical protein
MSGKVRIPKEVAAEIEKLRQHGSHADHYLLSLAFRYTHGKEGLVLFSFAQDHYDDYVQAIVNGYTVEVTPEDRVREFYEAFDDDASDHARTVVYTIKQTLNMLGITIAGVNADE